MSANTACRCPPGPEHRAGWRIRMWRANVSAFSGYRRTASEYSALTCITCGAAWRTKARYVESLSFLESPT